MSRDRFDVLERFEPLFDAPEPSLDGFLRRRDRRRRNQRITAGVVGIAVFVAAVWVVTSVGSPDRSQTPAVPGGAATATPTPTASASPVAAGPFVSEHYGYTIQMPSGWSAAQQATQTWDGEGAPGFDTPFVDLFDAPVGGAWAYAAPTDLTLTAYTRKTEHAAATEHQCPKPERDTAIRIDGTPARFLLGHCPATDGILVLLGITVHDGTAFIFAFQGPSGNRAAENEEAAEFLRLLAGVRL